MDKIRAVIFDMDGVMIDAKDWHYEALNRALALFGMEISRFDHLVTYDGLPTKKKLEMLSLENGLSRKLHDFINELKQLYTMELIFAKCKPVFCHQYALARLKKEGYKLGLCSNSVRESIQAMMKKAKLLEYFDVVLSNQDVSVSKPDPEIYMKAISKLEVSPQECLILEDNENGIKAVLSCGAHLLKIHHINDVTYDNIVRKINKIETSVNA